MTAAPATDVRLGGDVRLFLTARESGTGFTFDSRGFATATVRPALLVTIQPGAGNRSGAASE